jgi:hypothetical protein
VLYTGSEDKSQRTCFNMCVLPHCSCIPPELSIYDVGFIPHDIHNLDIVLALSFLESLGITIVRLVGRLRYYILYYLL